MALRWLTLHQDWWCIKTIHDDVLFTGSLVTAEFPSQRPVTRNFNVFFDPRLNKRLSKHSWGWWFETPSRRYDVTAMSLSHVTCFLKPAANISWRHLAKEQCCGFCTGVRGSHSVCRGALAIVSYKGRGLPALVQIMTWRRSGYIIYGFDAMGKRKIYSQTLPFLSFKLIEKLQCKFPVVKMYGWILKIAL